MVFLKGKWAISKLVQAYTTSLSICVSRSKAVSVNFSAINFFEKHLLSFRFNLNHIISAIFFFGVHKADVNVPHSECHILERDVCLLEMTFEFGFDFLLIIFSFQKTLVRSGIFNQIVFIALGSWVPSTRLIIDEKTTVAVVQSLAGGRVFGLQRDPRNEVDFSEGEYDRLADGSLVGLKVISEWLSAQLCKLVATIATDHEQDEHCGNASKHRLVR